MINYILTIEKQKEIIKMIDELEDKVNKGFANNRLFDLVYCELSKKLIDIIKLVVENEKEYKHGYYIDKALIFGGMARICKLLEIINKLIEAEMMEYEVAMDYSRKVIELSISVRYLIKNFGNKEIIDKYKYNAKKTEIIFIKKYKGKSKGFLINSAVLSAEKMIKKLRIADDVNKGVSVVKMFEGVGEQNLYDDVYRTLSHSIHCDSMDILRNDIVEGADKKFNLNFKHGDSNIRMYNPLLSIIIQSTSDLLYKFDSDLDKEVVTHELHVLFQAIEKLPPIFDKYIVLKNVNRGIDKEVKLG